MSHCDTFLAEPAAEQAAETVVAKTAGERCRGAVTDDGDGDVRQGAAEVDLEAQRILSRRLANQVNERLAEADDARTLGFACRHARSIGSGPVTSVSQIREQERPVAGIQTFLRRTDGDGVPTLFVHGNPTSSSDWIPFLKVLPGPGLAFDLPNFGRSERLAAERFDSSMHSYAAFIAAAMDELIEGEFNLVVHDWGAIALHPAQCRAERIRRLVVIDAVPLLADYRWHWLARIWRTRGLGELLNATTTKTAIRLALRQARPGLKPMPGPFVDELWQHYDRGMTRAVLRLYRSGDPEKLEAAGAQLERLACPAMVVWGVGDPYIPTRFARAFAARLPNAELLELDRAGHWPWIDQPQLVGRVVDFLCQSRE